MPSLKAFNEEVNRIRRLIKNTPFDRCLVLENSYRNLSFQAGVYALKSINGEVLYVGKASSFRVRFQGGHHALLRILMRSQLSLEQIRVVLAPVTERFVDDIELLEQHLIVAFDPAYNIRKRDPVEVLMSVPTTTFIGPGRVKELVQTLPDPVVEQIEAHADAYGLTESKILEQAISFYLDPEAVSFVDIKPGRYKGVGALTEENIVLVDENQFLKDENASLKDENEQLKVRLRELGVDNL